MADVSNGPVRPPPAKRRWRRRVIIALLLAALGWAGWYFGVELPEQQAAALRAANARTVPGLGLDLVWIAPGEFMMGSPVQNVLARWFYEAREKLTGRPNPAFDYGISDHARPLTRVLLTKPFWLGKTEVTQAQWRAVMGSDLAINFMGDTQPVEQASWEEAMEFCRELTERERVAGRLPAGYAFTLPTEAQWEYACRAGTTGDYAGDIDAMAWYEKNSGDTTHPVGTKRANAWGLCDMHGNVWEWCLDRFALYPGGQATDPNGPTSGTTRVVRGGSFDDPAMLCRSGIRDGDSQSHRAAVLGYIGFRVALVPLP